jgi:hypothetical protein
MNGDTRRVIRIAFYIAVDRTMDILEDITVDTDHVPIYTPATTGNVSVNVSVDVSGDVTANTPTYITEYRPGNVRKVIVILTDVQCLNEIGKHFFSCHYMFLLI